MQIFEVLYASLNDLNSNTGGADNEWIIHSVCEHFCSLQLTSFVLGVNLQTLAAHSTLCAGAQND